MKAARFGHFELANELLRKGAATDRLQEAEFLGAAYTGNFSRVKLSMRRGINVNVKTEEGENPVMLASAVCSMESVEAIIMAKAKLNQLSDYSESALMLAAKSGCVEVGKILIEHGEKVNLKGKRDGDGTAILYAAANGRADMVRLLISKGADTSGENGITALNYAVQSGSVDCAKNLLNSGVNINAKDFVENTPLIEAAESGDAEMVTALIERGASVNTVGGFYNETALMQASARGDIEVVRLLIAARAELDVQDVAGWTALINAAEKGYLVIVQELVNSGADVSLKNKWGDTALDASKRHAHPEVVRFLSQEQ